jgi:hypothetical protein
MRVGGQQGTKLVSWLCSAWRLALLQSTGGQTVAARLLGDVFADYTCLGSSPTHDATTYVGTHS